MVKRKYSGKPRQHQNLALEQIENLFLEAQRTFAEDPFLADRYVYIARRLSMKYKVPIPSSLKRQFCRHCFCYLVAGKNLRVRTRDGKLVYYCTNCKRFWRKPTKGKKAAKTK